jgi:hypothetical protein
MSARKLTSSVSSPCLIALLFSLFFASSARSGEPCSQSDTSDSEKISRLYLRDGSELYGAVIAETSDSLMFKTVSGLKLTVARTQVKNIEVLTGRVIDGEYRRVDPNRTRLLLAPTGRPLRAGQGYFSAYEIFFTFFSVGITDFLSFAGGLTLLPGAEDQLFYLAPKLTLPLHSEAVNIGAGIVYGNVFSSNSSGAGFVYGVGTFGSQYAAVTVGLGYGFAEGEFASKPVLVLGGETQVSSSIKLVTENWFAVGADSKLLSFGIRFFGEHLAADLGFMYPLSDEGGMSGFPFLPWVGFVYNFGTAN